jgi:hypothetical protein
MDPDATLDRLVQAIQDREYEDAAEAFKDLEEWVARGGFFEADSEIYYEAVVTIVGTFSNKKKMSVLRKLVELVGDTQ